MSFFVLQQDFSCTMTIYYQKDVYFDPLPEKHASMLGVNGPTGQPDKTVSPVGWASRIRPLYEQHCFIMKKTLNAGLSATRRICLFLGQEIISGSFLNELLSNCGESLAHKSSCSLEKLLKSSALVSISPPQHGFFEHSIRTEKWIPVEEVNQITVAVLCSIVTPEWWFKFCQIQVELIDG